LVEWDIRSATATRTAHDRDKDYRNTAVTLLPALYRESTPEQAARIVTTIEEMLADRAQDPSVRVRAGNALAEIGQPSSVEVISEAISETDDPVLKASLERNLNALETKP
jgi:HEAT repeat protein